MAEIKKCPRYLDWIPGASFYAAYRHFQFAKKLKKEKINSIASDALSDSKKSSKNEYGRGALLCVPMIGNGIALTIDGINWMIRKKSDDPNKSAVQPEQPQVLAIETAGQEGEPNKSAMHAEKPQVIAIKTLGQEKDPVNVEEKADAPEQPNINDVDESTDDDTTIYYDAKEDFDPDTEGLEEIKQDSKIQEMNEKEKLFEAFDGFWTSPEGIDDIRVILGFMLQPGHVKSWKKDENRFTIELDAPLKGKVQIKSKSIKKSVTVSFTIPKKFQVELVEEDDKSTKRILFTGNEKIKVNYYATIEIIEMKFDQKIDQEEVKKYVSLVGLVGKGWFTSEQSIRQRIGDAQEMWQNASWDY